LGTNSINFGEQVLLPDASNAVLWAEMEVKPTLTGSFVSTVFKSPELSLVTTLRNGQVRTNRFVPQMAHAGFVLSPFVKDCTSFATIASADWPSDLAQDAVTAFRIIPTDGHLPVSGYLNSILIRLYQLDFPRQNLEEVPGFHQVTELKEEIRRIKSVQNEKLTYLPDGGSVLAATGNSTVLFSRPPGASRLRLGFGLHSNDSKNTNAVTFVAVGANERGQATLLWSRHLDANSAPGKQDATVEIGSEEISRIALQTVSDHAGTNETCVPYWYQFRFE
jgi:hypothetical protein